MPGMAMLDCLQLIKELLAKTATGSRHLGIMLNKLILTLS